MKSIRSTQTWCLTGILVACLLTHSVALADSTRGSSYLSPTGANPQVLRAFDQPEKKWSAGHRGVDLAAEASGEVRAPAAGTVIFAGKVVDRGVLTIEHEDGRRSSFEPVTETLEVGTRVEAGQLVAQIDDSVPHCPTLCVHWGVRVAADEYINPMLLLGKEKPSVLLPVGEDFRA